MVVSAGPPPGGPVGRAGGAGPSPRERANLQSCEGKYLLNSTEVDLLESVGLHLLLQEVATSSCSNVKVGERNYMYFLQECGVEYRLSLPDRVVQARLHAQQYFAGCQDL